jgi:hypothetical protein
MKAEYVIAMKLSVKLFALRAWESIGGAVRDIDAGDFISRVAKKKMIARMRNARKI